MGPIHRLLAGDHARLDVLLTCASPPSGGMDLASFALFRAGILRHIGMEEKVLLQEGRRANGGEPLPMASRLRIDHGAIAILLVPSPTPGTVAEIRSILAGHNEVEEGPDGFYEVSDRLLAPSVEAVLERLRTFPEVKLAPHVDGPRVIRTAEEALRVSGRQRPRRR
jgi:hypothetical protein